VEPQYPAAVQLPEANEQNKYKAKQICKTSASATKKPLNNFKIWCILLWCWTKFYEDFKNLAGNIRACL